MCLGAMVGLKGSKVRRMDTSPSSLGAHSLVALYLAVDFTQHPHINLGCTFIEFHPYLVEMLPVAC